MPASKPVSRAAPLAAAGAAALLCLSTAAQAALGCEARSGERAPIVVELYTSEGCSSCPPADKWLSSLKSRDDVIALAFHVDYWDRLGWKDRFASADYTQRQAHSQRSSGARFSYTPQVLADGSDWRRWPELPATHAAALDLRLQRSGNEVSATVTPRALAPQQLAGFWAVVEDGHHSDVRSGENAGVTLHHDHVVTRLQPLAAWTGAASYRFELPAAAPEAGVSRRVVLVVTDAAAGRPLQALSLGC